ncbi:MAG: DUF362 domain-containing protein [Candidatus Methanofastidiosia archaeon]|jgi:uncharacterized protein (DUF362 family)
MVHIVHQKDKKKAFAEAVKDLTIEKNKTIAIKPNLSIKNEAACTDFELVSYVVDYLKTFSPQKILVVESDTYLRSIWDTYTYFGYQKLGVDLINVSEELCTTIWPKNTSFFKAFSYPEVLQDIDYIISFGKLKTHILTGYTGALKNQYGLIPFPDKRIFHKYLDKVIVGINQIFPCHFYILDGMKAMHKNGPLDGESIELNLIFSGTDPVAIDHCACTVVSIDPDGVSHLVQAEKAGIGSFTYEVQGDIPDITEFILPDY